jgi:L-Ala-D/L-Glu epimerase
VSSKSIEIIKAAIPLLEPYFLSFAKVEAFDCTYCKITIDDVEFWGETTALPGYSWETSASIENCIKNIVKRSSSLESLRHVAAEYQVSDPFAVGCISQALDKIETPLKQNPISLPLVGIISSSDQSVIDHQLKAQIDAGFSTIKVKVQGNLKSDLAKIRFLQEILPDAVKIRIDANQGFQYQDACDFVQALEPNKVELFEQPFKPNQWLEMEKLNESSPVPLMLDESIWITSDVEKAAESKCSAYVKLKMQKHGGIRRTVDLIKRSQNAGFAVVFGNGVQSILGCFDEIRLAQSCGVKTAGEFNGFLKHIPLQSEMISFNKGNAEVSGDFDFSDATIENYITGRVRKKLE